MPVRLCNSPKNVAQARHKYPLCRSLYSGFGPLFVTLLWHWRGVAGDLWLVAGPVSNCEVFLVLFVLTVFSFPRHGG